jgi:hypothetical protein
VAWYFNKKTQEFIENKDSENRENLPKDYYSDVGVHPYKMFKDFCCKSLSILLGIGDKPNNQDFQDSNGVFISDNTFTHLSLTYSTASRNSGFSLCFI